MIFSFVSDVREFGFTEEEGISLLNNLLKKKKKNERLLLVRVLQRSLSPQQDVFGNTFRIHKSL